jgi:hypothetical protein
MPKTIPAQAVEVLLAELSAALPARKSALEFERHFALADQAERINRGLFEIRVAEARLKSATADPLSAAASLGSMALAEAEDLEAEALLLEPLLGPSAAGRQIGVLRLVCALFRLARLGEGRARAFLTYARQGKHLLGFEEALELAPENELFFLALRRFRILLQAGGAWSGQDADWLRLRAASAPGRLRLRAAALRSGALEAAQSPLPLSLSKKRQPFIDYGFEPTLALAWAVAGFTPKEALAWGEAGLSLADQAQAWRDRGLSPEEASAWAQADLLPDEAAAFKACGAQDPAMARRLRQALGDVEHLLAWHRAGFEVADVLRLRSSGVQNVAQALTQRQAQAPTLKRGGFYGTEPVPARRPEAPSAWTEEPSSIQAEKEAEAPVQARSEDEASWAQARALRCFGALCEDEASALAAVPAQGGAWMGWGALETEGSAAAGGSPEAYTLDLGGGLMGTVAESEGVAVPGKSFAPPRMQARDGWQSRLDALRGARGLPPSPGQWHLHAWAPSRAWLFWGLAFKTAAVPWGEAMDFDSHETWLQRWARKTQEWGDDGMACPCAVGRSVGGGWWVAIKPSVQGSALGASKPQAIQAATMAPAWRDALQDFCLKMGVGARAGQWYLLAGSEAAPEQ